MADTQVAGAGGQSLGDSPSSKRRLIPIVDPRFQFKYTAIIVAIAAVVSTVLGYLLLKSYWEMNEITDIASLSPEVSAKLQVDDARQVFKITIAFLVVEVFVLGVMGLVVTHRVAGPVFVIHRHLLTLLEGRYPQTRSLRAGDEFRVTFEVFRTLIDALKKRDLDDVERLKAVLRAVEGKNAGDGEARALRQLIEEREARVTEG